MQEVKFNYQNIAVAFEGDKFTVKNKNLFINTDVYDARVILLGDGKPVMTCGMSFSVEPLCEKTFDIPSNMIEYIETYSCDFEFAVTVSFVLKADTIWAKAGHEVAFGQQIRKNEVAAYSSNARVELVRGNNTVGIRGENFSAIFSKMGDGLVSYVYGGVEMLPNHIPVLRRRECPPGPAGQRGR